MVEDTASRLLVRALDTLADSVEITDCQARLVYVNGAFERLTGWTRDEALGHRPRDLLRGDAHPDAFWEALWRELRAGRAWRGTLESRHRSGTPLVCEVTITPLLDDDGQVAHVVCVRQDPARRAALASEERRRGSLDGVNLLAAGVSHEVNNPLAWISADLELLQARIREAEREGAEVDRDEVRELLDEAQQGVTRIRRVLSDLRNFGEAAGRHTTRIEIHELVTFATDMLRAQLDERAELIHQVSATPAVQGDRVALAQVVLHLLLNALHAIDGQPARKITVSTRRGSDGCAVLEVADTGCGISEEYLPRVFEPFFTTRTAGEGAGLGLTHALKVVEAHGGTIELASTVDEGTRVTVRLPPSGPRAHASGPIVIIDDEPTMRRIMALSLGDRPLRVFATSREAREFLLHEDVGVVVCDLVLPGQSGPELFREVVTARPELRHRFLFVTGGGPHPKVEDFLAEGGHPVLAKPFRPAELNGWVDALLHDDDSTP